MSGTPIWITVLVAIIAAVGPVVSVWIQRRKPKEDAAAILVDSAMGLSEAMQKRISSLENRITELEGKLRAKEVEINCLEEELQSRNLEINNLKYRMAEMETKLKRYEKERDIGSGS